MKRFLMTLSLVVLLVVVLAVPAMAAEHTHCICGGTLEGKEGHTCQDITFTEVTTADAFTQLFTGESANPVNICLRRASPMTMAGSDWPLMRMTVFPFPFPALAAARTTAKKPYNKQKRCSSSELHLFLFPFHSSCAESKGRSTL